MTPWQVLRAHRATQAAVGYRAPRHGAGASVHYSAAPDGRGSCVSAERLAMQQLNGRLASYLQQVQFLEAANQKLECEIQKELSRKCPRELRELDGHLRTVSLLQDQIRECLSAQAQVKLHMLGAELTVFDLNVRCEKERECRGCLEVDLNKLRLLQEELKVQRLPELQSRLNDQAQQMMGMQIQHQQDMQGLLTQMSGGIDVKMQPAESSDLIQQLDDLRQTSVMPLDKNQTECWFNTQVSALSSPEVTCGPPAGSEVFQAELEEVRRRAASLEEELIQLQSMNAVLEASGQQHNESIIQQLVVLQERADSLCRDLDSVLQATAQQAADHQTLLDVKTRLEAEIQDYKGLLDRLSPHSPSAFRRNITVNKAVSVQEGNLRMMEFQAVSRGHVHTGQTPVVAPFSEAMTTVTLINTSSLTGSSHKSENHRTGAVPERTGKESLTITMVKNQSSTVEHKAHIEDLQNSLIANKEAVFKTSKQETNISQGISTLLPDTQSARSAAVQAKPESFTSKLIPTEADLQANKTETHIQTEITKTILCAEPEVKQGLHFPRHMTTSDPSKQTVADMKKTGTVISVHMDSNGNSIQTEHQDPAQVVSLSVETPTEAVSSTREVTATASCVSESQVVRSEEAQVQASGDLTLDDDKDIERQEKKGEKEAVEVGGTSCVLKLAQSAASSHKSTTEQNKVMEDADTQSSTSTASSDSPEGKVILESKTAQGIIPLVPDTQSARITTVQAKPESFPSKLIPTEADLQANKTETHIQTEITKTILCAESEVKQGLHFPRCMTTSDPSKQTVADMKKTGTVISAHMDSNGDSIQTEHQDPAQVVSLSVETPTEAVSSTREATATASCVSESQVVGSEEVQVQVSGDLTLIDDKDIERQEKREGKAVVEVKGTLFDQSIIHESKSKENKVMEDADTGSSTAKASSGSPDSNNILESKAASTVILKKVESDANKGMVVNSFHDTNEVKVGPTESNNEMVKLAGREALLTTTESKKSTHISESNSGGVAASNSDIARKVAANFGDTAVNLSDTASANAEVVTTGVQGRFGYDSGVPKSYGSSLGNKSTSLTNTGSKESPSGAMLPVTSQQQTERFSSSGNGEWVVYGGSVGRKSSLDSSTSLPSKATEEDASVHMNTANSPQEETGRFSSRGSREWIVYSGSLGRKSSFRKARSEESQSAFMLSATSSPEINKFGGGRSGEKMVHSGSIKRTSSLTSSDSLPTATQQATSSAGRGKSDSRGSGEWRVYGGSAGCMRSNSLPSTDQEDILSAAAQLPTSPAGSLGGRRFGSGGSGEWRVYGGSSERLSSASSAERVSVSAKHNQMNSSQSSNKGSGPRLSSTGSTGKRSNSVGSGGRLSSSGSGGRLSSSSGSHRTSTSGRYTSTGSGEWKPVYSSTSARKSSVGSVGRTGGGVVISMGGGGWVNSSTASGNCISSPGSGSKLSGTAGSDRISGRAGGRISGSSGSGRTNSTGGRVITSSDRPIRSTGSGTGSNKERISVCKMAALSISAAGREKSQDRKMQTQKPQQQQKAAGTSPLLQRWLTTGVGDKSAEPDGLDDIMRL